MNTRTYNISILKNLISDYEDVAHECNAYMRTKQFMSKKIYENQIEINGLLKDVQRMKKGILFYLMLR